MGPSTIVQAFKEVFKGYDEEEGNEIAWCQKAWLSRKVI